MKVKENGYRVKNHRWDNIIKATLPDTYVTNTHDMLWAVDAHRKLIFANNAYFDFMLKTTGTKIQVDDYAYSPDGNKEMVDKWDYFYGRALNGEQFHIITNLVSQNFAMIVDANFIPLVCDQSILGTACLARTTSTMVEQSMKKRDEENENNSFISNS